MKKIIFVLSLLVGVIACSKKINPATTTTTTNPTTEVTTTPVTTTAPTVPDKPKSEEVVPAKEEAKPVIAGADDTDPTLIKGRAIYTGKCIKCHNANPVENFTAARWDGILRSMIPKSKLNFEEAAQVTAYVKAHCKK